MLGFLKNKTLRRVILYYRAGVGGPFDFYCSPYVMKNNKKSIKP